MTDTPDTLPIDRLFPHPDNPRLQLREDVVERLAAEIRRNSFRPEHAILVRPHNGGWQIVSGHHRVEAAGRAGLAEVPAWVRDMDDDEAFMLLVLGNTQGELSPLEIGMHALRAVAPAERKAGQGLKAGQRDTRWGTKRDVQYLMLVEVKVHGRDMDAPQRDLLAIVNDLLRTNAWKEQRVNGQFISGHAQNARSVYSYIAGKRVRVYCYGVHKLRMSGATPELSQWMTWSDGGGIERYITQDDLVRLLRFDTNPDSLRPLEHREHKTRIEPPAALFDVTTT